MAKDEHFDSMVSIPCVQALVQFFNVIFWFAGLSIIWMSIWLRTEFDIYLCISTGYSTVPPLVMLATGAIIIIVTSLACSCIVRVQSPLLIFYGGCLIVMLFGLVCVSIYIYAYKDDVTNGLEGGLQHAIDTYDVGNTNDSRLIDDIQRNLHCCGIETYLDWPKGALPVSCCTTFPCDLQNGSSSSSSSSIYTDGCQLALQHIVDSNLTTLGVILTAVALFPLFGAISAFALATNVPTFGKHHYEVIP